MQKEIGWESNIVPTHIFRADSIHLVDENINLGYVLLAVISEKGSQDAVIGFARVTSTMNPKKHWLHEIAVSSKIQCQGVGYGLMKAIKKKSLELGCTELYFPRSNIPANLNIWLKAVVPLWVGENGFPESNR